MGFATRSRGLFVHLVILRVKLIVVKMNRELIKTNIVPLTVWFATRLKVWSVIIKVVVKADACYFVCCYELLV